ncbi:factor Xa inhibitor BuXI-like [Andrographis paniculata]|uniref:factor Xa inhibitor BuXI-like n=1 Tax=Andrographis paniculata TaxID=175694 RepID=UPI0021E80926|nr:factor Xa inhibitor BuXI-like [Andrographis paniculata]
MVIKLFSLFSLLLILIHGVSGQQDDDNTPVLDSDGDAVNSSTEYYISYAGAGFRGGIGLPWGSKLRCPARVIQMPFRTQIGLPVAVRPTLLESPFWPPSPLPIVFTVYVNQSVEISFSESVTGCPDGQALWDVEFVPEVQKDVVAGTWNQQKSEFKILQTGKNNVYTFASCARWSPCRELGLYRMRRRQHLSVNNQPNDLPYTFQFVKKNPANGVELPK